jgi:hypothetical protein
LLFRSFTGLELPEFDSIYKKIESKYSKYEVRRLSKRKRTRKVVGAGNHFKLAVRDTDFLCFWYTIDCT